MNVVRLEQIKLYSLLVQHFGKQLLCAEPFLRPLLKLLCSFRVDITTPDVEGFYQCFCLYYNIKQFLKLLLTIPSHSEILCLFKRLKKNSF